MLLIWLRNGSRFLEKKNQYVFTNFEGIWRCLTIVFEILNDD